jgi:hypothetical protein
MIFTKRNFRFQFYQRSDICSNTDILIINIHDSLNSNAKTIQLLLLLLLFSTPLHLNGMGCCELLYIRGKPRRCANPLPPRFTCALYLPLPWYRWKLAEALLHQEISNSNSRASWNWGRMSCRSHQAVVL